MNHCDLGLVARDVLYAIAQYEPGIAVELDAAEQQEILFRMTEFKLEPDVARAVICGLGAQPRDLKPLLVAEELLPWAYSTFGVEGFAVAETKPAVMYVIERSGAELPVTMLEQMFDAAEAAGQVDAMQCVSDRGRGDIGDFIYNHDRYKRLVQCRSREVLEWYGDSLITQYLLDYALTFNPDEVEVYLDFAFSPGTATRRPWFDARRRLREMVDTYNSWNGPKISSSMLGYLFRKHKYYPDLFDVVRRGPQLLAIVLEAGGNYEGWYRYHMDRILSPEFSVVLERFKVMPPAPSSEELLAHYKQREWDMLIDIQRYYGVKLDLMTMLNTPFNYPSSSDCRFPYFLSCILPWYSEEDRITAFETYHTTDREVIKCLARALTPTYKISLDHFQRMLCDMR